ncbi:abortive infection protein [Microseira wollei NIES-4236]|uniref:Abortive infection protein n=1 Tax=Microseira wollei NIES-4236 TaxID=2530354 RepID=A0AAV3X9W2_9CYAN|nr:abortive infection protein [Microseira wollei NIES-4236]
MGVWTGRLILPAKELREIQDKTILFEVQKTDRFHDNLVGKTVNLKWSDKKEVQEYVQSVTLDVRFTQETKKSQKSGQLHPERLNNWKKVDPLESLAGARGQDDVIVMLKNPAVVSRDSGEKVSLVIDREPVQVTARFYGLVTIIKRKKKDSDRFLVRHYNKSSKQFDDIPETIRIPQVPADRDGIPRSTNIKIESSPLNSQGWYIYGAKGADGIFVVQAIEPRAILRLKPDEVRLGLPAGKYYIKHKIWKNVAREKGTAKTVLLDPVAQKKTEAVGKWREGDRAIVIHTFGGIGGKKAEPTPLGMVTGHFSYGIARVVRDRFTNELRFDIEYQQVYAHNPDGIIAGSIKWSSYMGDLWRGWLGTRPVCDIIVKLDAVTEDYNFDGIKLSPLGEFTRQLDIMMARYRIGDGTGAAIVTPATSCVQDSNFALYATIKQIQADIASNSQIQDWLQRHPNEPQTLRFQKLVELGRSLEKNLIPWRTVRSDWYYSTAELAGTRQPDSLILTLIKAITTWRTIMPRQAQDEIATILLKNGGSLWIIRTNQVGGFDPDIAPLATTAFRRWNI